MLNVLFVSGNSNTYLTNQNPEVVEFATGYTITLFSQHMSKKLLSNNPNVRFWRKAYFLLFSFLNVYEAILQRVHELGLDSSLVHPRTT